MFNSYVCIVHDNMNALPLFVLKTDEETPNSMTIAMAGGIGGGVVVIAAVGIIVFIVVG